mmetsp:Transcript_11625/g.23153  ORF Transcript_11625/g.23153 Transcript_11625/m.23153 type:complete len:217 (-) Transcript_11625:410-1060(-)
MRPCTPCDTSWVCGVWSRHPTEHRGFALQTASPLILLGAQKVSPTDGTFVALYEPFDDALLVEDVDAPWVEAGAHLLAPLVVREANVAGFGRGGEPLVAIVSALHGGGIVQGGTGGRAIVVRLGFYIRRLLLLCFYIQCLDFFIGRLVRRGFYIRIRPLRPRPRDRFGLRDRTGLPRIGRRHLRLRFHSCRCTCSTGSVDGTARDTPAYSSAPLQI